jgi:hypothetical protein
MLNSKGAYIKDLELNLKRKDYVIKMMAKRLKLSLNTFMDEADIIKSFYDEVDRVIAW